MLRQNLNSKVRILQNYVDFEETFAKSITFFGLMKLSPIPLIDDPLNDGQNKASMKPTDVYGNIED